MAERMALWHDSAHQLLRENRFEFSSLTIHEGTETEVGCLPCAAASRGIRGWGVADGRFAAAIAARQAAAVAGP